MRKSPQSEIGQPVSSGPTFVPFGKESDASNNDTDDTLVDLQLYYIGVRKRMWLVVLVALLVAAAAGLYTSRQPKLYRAECSLVMGNNTPQVLTGVTDVVESQPLGYWGMQTYYATEHKVMVSRAVARLAGEKVDILHMDDRVGLSDISDAKEREQKRATLDAADFVVGSYKVRTDDESSIVVIRVVDHDPQFAADLANAVAEAYMDLNLDKKVKGTRDASTWLAVQHQDLKKKLEASEDKLYGFLEENNVLNASMESQLEEVRQRIQTFVGRHAEIEAEIIQNKLYVEAIQSVAQSPEVINSLDEIRGAAIVAGLKEAVIELEAKRADFLAERYREGHPKIKEIDDRIATMNKKIEEEVQAVIVGLERKHAGLVESEKGLRQAINRERFRESKLNKLVKDTNRLRRDVETNSKLYDMITSRMKEADLTGALRFNNVSILDSARPPESPFKPDMRRNLLMALVLGFLLGVVFALVLDHLDNTVKSQMDVERMLDVPFLGMLPAIEPNNARKGGDHQLKEVRRRDLYVADNPKSYVAESARFIRTNLMFMSPERPLQSLLVTSPGPQEGKTTAAVSIAVAMGQAGARTLLVDCDMRRPRLHRTFQISNDQGLANIIVGDIALEDAVVHMDDLGLDVLVCGPPPPNPVELLHTKRFRALLEDMESKYDHVIFDAPPVGAVADPVVLGTIVDGALLLLKAGATKRDLAKTSLRSLRDANVELFGAVLNDIDVTSKRYGSYYYQYYRRYGGYYGENPQEATGPVPPKAAEG